MIFYVLIAAFIAGGVGGGWAVNSYRDLQQARQVRALESARVKVETLTKEFEQEAANHIADMVTAQEAGEAKGRAEAKTIYIKGQSYVAANPQIFASAQCAIPADGVRQLNDSITAVRSAAAADVLGIAVPGAGANNNANATGGRSVPALPVEPSAASGVHREVPQPAGATEISGSVLQRPPKPNPTGR